MAVSGSRSPQSIVLRCHHVSACFLRSQPLQATDKSLSTTGSDSTSFFSGHIHWDSCIAYFAAAHLLPGGRWDQFHSFVCSSLIPRTTRTSPISFTRRSLLFHCVAGSLRLPNTRLVPPTEPDFRLSGHTTVDPGCSSYAVSTIDIITTLKR